MSAQAAPEAAIREEVAALRAQIAALQKDVDTIRNLLEMLAARQHADEPPVGPAGSHALRIAGRPSIGRLDAPLVVLEFTDYECPYCAQHAAQVWPEIEREYVRTGRVRYVFKNLPPDQSASHAFKAALAAGCASDQGRFEPFHARLFANQSKLSPADLVQHASATGLDLPAFETCLAAGTHAAHIREDVAEALRGGVRGTPVFVLAVPGEDPGAVVPARVLVGAQPFAAFKQAFDQFLSQPPK